MEVRVVVKAMLLNDAQKILILQRSQTDPLRPGAVDFPGGRVEAGEDVLQGAVREIMEETGLRVAPSDLVIVFAKMLPPNHDGHTILRIICAGRTSEQDVVLSYEHDTYWWSTTTEVLSEFDNEVWYEGLQFVLRHNLLPASPK